ncbi:hypothetical protein CVT24_002112 [Panaeolus cyanescens]|uniref:Uncharacterized protein n=1 Tax=Panaeolus cyanescens TaxID=181874 RepID=A0A409YI78_9AGAR|nr:hypothetical protein CVT24_002112 [Panaeolus cyanescens]
MPNTFRRVNSSSEDKDIASSSRGARVFYWTATGSRECGSVIGSNTLKDNTTITAIHVDRTGETVIVPSAALHPVEQARN